jgi:hypothetical protein
MAAALLDLHDRAAEEQQWPHLAGHRPNSWLATCALTLAGLFRRLTTTNGASYVVPNRPV